MADGYWAMANGLASSDGSLDQLFAGVFTMKYADEGARHVLKAFSPCRTESLDRLLTAR